MNGDVILYVISLPKDNPRRAQIAGALDNLGLTAQFIDAVDGRNGLPTQWEAHVDRAGTKAFSGRVLSDAEYACALSHRIAYAEFLASGAKWAVVLEDDALIDENFVRFLREGAYRAAPMLLLHHANARVYAGAPILPGYDALPLAMSPFMAAAYSVDRNAAQALLQALTPVRSTADWPLDLSALGACAIDPQVVGHPPMGTGSNLAQTRGTNARGVAHYLSWTYLRRKWRKLRSRRIS